MTPNPFPNTPTEREALQRLSNECSADLPNNLMIAGLRSSTYGDLRTLLSTVDSQAALIERQGKALDLCRIFFDRNTSGSEQIKMMPEIRRALAGGG